MHIWGRRRLGGRRSRCQAVRRAERGRGDVRLAKEVVHGALRHDSPAQPLMVLAAKTARFWG